MLAIRLARVGAKKKPAYRVVVIDKRRARDSKNIEIVGHYNPTTDPITLSLKEDRIAFWRLPFLQPPPPHRARQRHHGARSEPASATISSDAAHDALDHRRGQERQAPRRTWGIQPGVHAATLTGGRLAVRTRPPGKQTPRRKPTVHSFLTEELCWPSAWPV